MIGKFRLPVGHLSGGLRNFLMNQKSFRFPGKHEMLLSTQKAHFPSSPTSQKSDNSGKLSEIFTAIDAVRNFSTIDTVKRRILEQ